MATNTKEKILENALSLFNRYGYVNVRLQHIADEAGISVGNLAYHFKTKDDIIENIYGKLEGEQKELLSELHIVPLFVNIDTHLSNVFNLQKKYSFFYSDTFEVVRAFPKIKKKYREYTSWFLMQINNMIHFNVSRGVFNESTEPDFAKNLAINYWTIMELWLYQNRIRGIDVTNENDFKIAIWSLLRPYFTELGVKEYKQINQQLNYNWL